MEIMSALLNERRCRELLNNTLPVVTYSESEYQRLLHAAAMLMERPESDLSEEACRLPEMLSMLIEEYEDRVRPLPKPTPGKMLNHVVQERGLTPGDLKATLPKKPRLRDPERETE